MRRNINFHRITLLSISLALIFGLFFELFYRLSGDLFSERWSWLSFGRLFLAVLSVSAVVSFWCWLLFRGSGDRLPIHSYEDREPSKRVFFEVIGDLIGSMYGQVGPSVMVMVGRIKGLKMDKEGKVLSLDKDPTEILTMLLLNYERYFKRKAKLRFRDGKGRKEVLKNLGLFKEYFEKRRIEQEKAEKEHAEYERQKKKEAKKAEKSDIYIDSIKRIN